MGDGFRKLALIQGQNSDLLVVAGRNALKQLPFTVHQRQQIGEVRFRTALGFVFSLGPVDHLVSNKRLYVAFETLRQLLILLDGEMCQVQPGIELLGIEQPDQDLHHDRVREIQS